MYVRKSISTSNLLQICHFQSTEEYIVYENSIGVNNYLTRGMIQRQHEKAISFRCHYNRKNKLSTVEFIEPITYVIDI